MAKIHVTTEETPGGWTACVDVVEGKSRTDHTVTISKSAYKKLVGTKSTAVDDLVRKSFEFLLEREPKESILGRFEITVIGQYFPEYPREIAQRLSL